MDWWLLTFFLGSILSLFFPEVPAIFQLFLLLCVAIAFFCHKNLRSSSGLLFGALWILSQAYLYQNQLPTVLIDKMEKKEALLIEGEILSLLAQPTRFNKVSTMKKANDTVRFNFRIDKVLRKREVAGKGIHNLLTSPIVVRLSWKNPTLVLSQGQKLLLNTKLKPAHGLANTGTFNYLSWLKANNITATGYVINKKNNQARTSNYQQKINKNLYSNQHITNAITYRQQLFDYYKNITPTHELTSILLALAFGERSLIDDSQWKTLQATGTSHLIAISGLHIGLLASGMFYLVGFVIRHSPISNPYWQQVNMRYVAILVSLLAALVYAYLAGFSLPTQRALVMLLLYWCSRLMAINLSSKRLLLITLFFVILYNPFSLLTASFWLSFYAVTIIFLSLWRFKAWLIKGSALWRFIKGLVIIQLSLTFMLLPVTGIFFQQVSWVSLAANIIAVPWMSLISIPCTLLSVLVMPVSAELSLWLMEISLLSLTWLWQYLFLLSELPYAITEISWYQQVMFIVIGGFSFVSLFIWPWRLSSKITSIVIVVTLMISLISFFIVIDKFEDTSANESFNESTTRPSAESARPWEVVFFDVGQGLSVLIKRNGHGILYDTGAAYPSGFTMSEAVILPYLQYIGMDNLDKVILSHSDNDHAGGIAQLEDNIVITELMSNDTSIMNRAVSDCYRGDTFNWQGLTFDVLSPVKQVSNLKAVNETKQKNDDSCVVLISDKYGNNVLLTGDISQKIEQGLLSQYPKLTVDVLQVPHHGSKTSSSLAFIKQLSPQVALVSAGYLNRWNMPVQTVKQRYIDENIMLLNSAEVGQVIVTINDEGIVIRSYIHDLRPFWFSY